MEHWPWWLGGLALAGVALVHWFLVERMMAVSGRYSAMINRMRFGSPRRASLSREELVEAIRAATIEAGGSVVEEPPPPKAVPAFRPPQSLTAHLVFLGGLTIGGLLAGMSSGSQYWTLSLHGELFARLVGGGTWGALVLLAGGVLIGFGTRMAAGCTSGHGLCGVSRFQSGSILATVCFFGSGIGVSWLLGVLL